VDEPQDKRQASGPASFDQHARTYDEVHAESIKASGESTVYFAEYKLQCLVRLGAEEPILDFGCGIGNLTEQLVHRYRRVHGYDPSTESLNFAKPRAPGAVFHEKLADVPEGAFQTVVLAGVLHHVEPNERGALLGHVREKLAPGGKIVVFEHNPLNPLTRYAVAACDFDDDANLLWPWQLRRTLVDAGFSNVDLRYIVFFPKILAALRPLEPMLGRFWAGAQTMCTATKPP
jgi:2-polyprenyl-3-methyl-5-hydroxy-6-metoxy-1,4-benzoquinol methylase